MTKSIKFEQNKLGIGEHCVYVLISSASFISRYDVILINAVSLICLKIENFESYDFGEAENLRRYNQTTPLQYQLEKV